jgi:hypothetical protein
MPLLPDLSNHVVPREDIKGFIDASITDAYPSLRVFFDNLCDALLNGGDISALLKRSSLEYDSFAEAGFSTFFIYDSLLRKHLDQDIRYLIAMSLSDASINLLARTVDQFWHYYAFYLSDYTGIRVGDLPSVYRPDSPVIKSPQPFFPVELVPYPELNPAFTGWIYGMGVSVVSDALNSPNANQLLLELRNTVSAASSIAEMNPVAAVAGDLFTLSVTGLINTLALPNNGEIAIRYYNASMVLLGEDVAVFDPAVDTSTTTKTVDGIAHAGSIAPNTTAFASVQLRVGQTYAGASGTWRVFNISFRHLRPLKTRYSLRTDIVFRYDEVAAAAAVVPITADLLQVFRPGRLAVMLYPVLEINYNKLVSDDAQFDAFYYALFVGAGSTIYKPSDIPPLVTDATPLWITDSGITSDGLGILTKLMGFTNALWSSDVNGVGAVNTPVIPKLCLPPAPATGPSYMSYEFEVSGPVRYLLINGISTLCDLHFDPSVYTWSAPVNYSGRMTIRIIYNLYQTFGA